MDLGANLCGSVPALIGEIGIAYNLNRREAFRTGDWRAQAEAMDDTMQAVEANLVGCTLWNYTADNTNEWGDRWNNEDLSIFSRDQQAGTGSLDDGGRALEAVVRPYARSVAGEPLRMAFDYKTGEFLFEFRPDPAVRAPLEVYLPAVHYGAGCSVEASTGRYEVDLEASLLRYWPDPTVLGVHCLRVTRAQKGAG
jgi:hypothetical protein